MGKKGIENFRPNSDGTFGPYHWTEQQLCEWAYYDIQKTTAMTNALLIVGVIAIVLTIVLTSGHKI